MTIPASSKKYLFYGRLLLSFSILIYLISIIDLERIKIIYGNARIEYAWLAFILLLFTNLATSIRWSFLLNHWKIKQRVSKSFRFYLIGSYYSIILPGVIGGDVIRLGLSIEANKKCKALLTTSILFERFCGIMVIMLMASISTILMPVILEGEKVIEIFILGISITAILLFTLFFYIIKNHLGHWFNTTGESNGWKHKTNLILQSFQNLSFRIIFSLLVLSLLAHFFDIVGSFFIAKALHIKDMPLSVFLLIMPIVYVLTILPISIGGIGVREGVLTFFLSKVGVMATDAVLLAFAIYINRVLVGLIGGCIQLNEKKKNKF